MTASSLESKLHRKQDQQQLPGTQTRRLDANLGSPAGNPQQHRMRAIELNACTRSQCADRTRPVVKARAVPTDDNCSSPCTLPHANKSRPAGASDLQAAALGSHAAWPLHCHPAPLGPTLTLRVCPKTLTRPQQGPSERAWLQSIITGPGSTPQSPPPADIPETALHAFNSQAEPRRRRRAALLAQAQASRASVLRRVSLL